jgi:hypothetical protein
VPPFVLSVSDCDGPLDTTNTVVEVSMWAAGKLKKPLTPEVDFFSLADDIGFDQSLPGDIILMNRVRNPEMMLVVGHDEAAKTIRVIRGYQGTQAGTYPRGNKLRMFRVLNGIGEAKMVNESVDQVDGGTEEVLTDSQLLYNWRPNDTCLPGCYLLEFKLLKMTDAFVSGQPPAIISGVSSSSCDMGIGVEWVRRFPVDGEGFLVQIFDSPTSENLV